MMLSDFLVPFVAVGLAEVGDKTQIAVLILSSKTRRHAPLLLGVMSAFLLVDGLAVLVGSWAAAALPTALIRKASGAVFILFGLMMLRQGGGESADGTPSRGPFLSGLIAVSLMEFGDKTQITAALLAAEYDPLMVLGGTLAALFLLSYAAVYIGATLAKNVGRRLLHRVGAAVFVILGASLLAV
jgi:Ca2+/H+ antiporter, TMEM165/GDT1 family